MTIAYFSGTGNSFHAATLIAEGGNASIIPISGLMENGKLALDAETLILVCPVYFYGMPALVADFLERVELPNVGYFSAVFTAEYPNGKAIAQLGEICKRKSLKLNSAFYLKMPTNYLIKSRMPEPEEIRRIMDRAERKIAKICAVIAGRRQHLESDSALYSLFVGADTAQKYWKKAYPHFDSKFWSDRNCTSCALCQNNCPLGNIVVEGKPRWNRKCSACLKCVNICPLKAIQYGDTTEGKKRYFNPRVRLSDMNDACITGENNEEFL